MQTGSLIFWAPMKTLLIRLPRVLLVSELLVLIRNGLSLICCWPQRFFRRILESHETSVLDRPHSCRRSFTASVYQQFGCSSPGWTEVSAPVHDRVSTLMIFSTCCYDWLMIHLTTIRAFYEGHLELMVVGRQKEERQTFILFIFLFLNFIFCEKNVCTEL